MLLLRTCRITRCAEAGITWAGPPIEAIKLMGDKRRRVAVAKRGVAVVPGYDGEDRSDVTVEDDVTSFR